MTYQESIDYLYSQLPMYQNIGSKALKKDLRNIRALCGHLGDPHLQYPTVHVAGTNGKGTTTHALAAVLQAAGYRTGLYTSPHLKDFRERIKVDGALMDKRAVSRFVTRHRDFIERVKPSFFEITVAMAFDYFSSKDVDIAVIEVGLGGRLDSTNIVEPVISIITNISFDHNAILGNTLKKIATEKAGIIKPGVPVVIGERNEETEGVFRETAARKEAPISYAYDRFKVRVLESQPKLLVEIYQDGKLKWDSLDFQLNGPYQPQNLPAILESCRILKQTGFCIDDRHIELGFSQIVELTGLKGRWQIIGRDPLVICDTGHNRAAMEYIVGQLLNLSTHRLHLVLGFVNDKDIRGMLALIPRQASVYFCAATVPRSLPATDLAAMASTYGIQGKICKDPNHALQCARENASPRDVIFVGGSTFVVAELREI